MLGIEFSPTKTLNTADITAPQHNTRELSCSFYSLLSSQHPIAGCKEM
jgi:hypothetical protein